MKTFIVEYTYITTNPNCDRIVEVRARDEFSAANAVINRDADLDINQTIVVSQKGRHDVTFFSVDINSGLPVLDGE